MFQNVNIELIVFFFNKILISKEKYNYFNLINNCCTSEILCQECLQ